MADVLISYDEAGYLRIKGSYDRIAVKIQGIVDSYNLLGFGDLAANELLGLFQAPIDFIFDKMTGGQPVSIGGLQVDKQKAIDILIKPAGYDAFVNAITGTKGSIKDDEHYSNVGVAINSIADLYTINVSGDVVITGAFDTKLQEQNKLYAKSDLAKAVLTFAQNFLQTADELGLTNIFKSNPNGVGHTISYLIKGGTNSPTLGGSDPNFSINAKFVVQFNDPSFSGRP